MDIQAGSVAVPDFHGDNDIVAFLEGKIIYLKAGNQKKSITRIKHSDSLSTLFSAYFPSSS